MVFVLCHLPRWLSRERTCLPMRETYATWVPSLGREDPLEEDVATPSSILPGGSQGQRSLSDYSPWGCKESTRMGVIFIREGIDSHHVWNGNGPPTPGTPKPPHSLSPSAPSGMWVLWRQGCAFLVSANPTTYCGIWPKYLCLSWYLMNKPFWKWMPLFEDLLKLGPWIWMLGSPKYWAHWNLQLPSS